MDYKAHITRPEDQVNNMDITQISRIDTAKFFKSSNLKELNRLLINICKHVFIEAYNNAGKEAGAVLNIKTKKYEYKEALQYSKINFKDIEILKDADVYSCITFHTHPDISIFSIQDVKNLLEDKVVRAIVLVNAACNIFVLVKDPNKDYNELIDYLYSQFHDFLAREDINKMEEFNLKIRRVTL